MTEFEEEKQRQIARMGHDEELQELSRQWFELASRHNYSYHFQWLGRPIIQFPQDILAMQEIIWNTKPRLIVEAGIAHGGSLVFYASMLDLIGEDGQVVGVDIEIREHNRREIEQHPMNDRINMIEGSSTDEQVVQNVYEIADGQMPVLVVLDSNHTHDHVLRELELYSPLVTRGSYLVVFDTVVEDLPEDFFPDRPWSKGNNPKTAVEQFLNSNDRFEVDLEITNKLLITVAPDGYLRCVKD